MKLKKINVRNSIYSFIKRRYGQVFLSLLLFAVSILSLRIGLYLLSNDNYSPELDPWMSVSRYLESPAWRGYRVLGFASDSEQADIFRSFIYGISSLVLPKWILGQIFSLLCIWIGTLSIASLTTKIARDFFKTKHLNIVYFVSGILYISTLWTAWVFNFNMMPYVTQFGFLPLLLLAGYQLLKEWNAKNMLFFTLSTLLLMSTFVIATLFFVNLVFIAFMLLIFAYLGKVNFKKVFITLLLFLSMQLFWLLPFIQYTVSTSSDVIDSYTNRSITANTIDLEKQMMTFVNSARFYTRLLGTVDDPSAESYIFPMSEDYIGYDFYKVISLLPFVLSVIGLIFIVFQKRWKLIFFWFVLLGILLLITNLNPPTGFIYSWLQESFNIFAQVFRWVSSKLGQPYLILLTITATIGFLSLLDFWSSFIPRKANRYFSFLLLILLCAPLVFFSEYIVRGDLFTKRATVDLPSQYYELAKFLKDDTDGRIFYAPPANNGYFREYDWGFVGSQFLGYIVPNPILDMSLAIGSAVGEKAMLELNNDLHSGEIHQLNTDLEKYDVKYVLVDRSLIKGRYGHEMNWEALDEYVKDLDLVWSSEFLELYRLKSFESGNFSESLGDSDRELEPFFRRKVPRDPQINIFALDMKGADLVNGYITKEFIYSGNDTRVYSNLRNIDINNLPTKWVREASYITVRPLLPNINNVEIEHIRSFMLPGENSHYIIGNNVFSSQDLVRGIHSSFPWKDVSEISFVRDNSWLKSEYTDRIANLKAADCSSNEFSVLPTISVEKDFTGFVLRGDTDLPCVSKKISLDSRERYIARININWEASVDNQMGFCLYSKSKGDCINKDKYFNTKDGFGNLDFTFPTVIEGSDEISLILYALNSKGERASITVRNISLFLSSSFEKASLLSERMESTSEIISLKNDETYSVNIPIVISDSAYIFDSDVQKSLIWQPSRAEDSTLLYSVSSDSGMKQKVFNQYMNQYQRLFNTSPSTKYLWFWEGENISNIPATLCLTYSGDDKCWVDNMFFTKEHTSFTHIFLPSKSKFQTLEASYNSISFASDSVNVLKSFVVMPIPLEWFEFQYSPIISDEYVEQKATKISNSAHSTFYEFKGSSYRKTLLTIPQSFSNGWSAIKLSKSGVKILGDDTVVSVNGWKQGWDISEIGDYQKIVIFYWPNLLAYFGYAIIIITIVTLSVFLIREKRNYGKR